MSMDDDDDYTKLNYIYRESIFELTIYVQKYIVVEEPKNSLRVTVCMYIE